MMWLFEIFRTRFDYEEQEFSRFARRDALKAEFYRLRRVWQGSQETGVPFLMRVPPHPAEQAALQKQLKIYLLLSQQQQAEGTEHYGQTQDPAYLETLVELSEMQEWLQTTIQSVAQQDPQQPSDNRYVAVDLPAFKGTCRITFRENVATAFLFAVGAGRYSLTLEDDRRGTTHRIDFAIREKNGEDEMFSVALIEEGIDAIANGTMILSDGTQQETISLD